MARGPYDLMLDRGVQWDEKGRPFYFTSDGKRDYIPPIMGASMWSEPAVVEWARQQGYSFDISPEGEMRGSTSGYKGGTWSSQEGKFKRSPMDIVDKGMIAAIGALIGAPLLGAAVGGGGAASAAGAGAGTTGSTVPVIGGLVPATTGTLTAAGAGGGGLEGILGGIGKTLGGGGGGGIGKKILGGLIDYGIPALLGGVGEALSGPEGYPPQRRKPFTGDIAPEALLGKGMGRLDELWGQASQGGPPFNPPAPQQPARFSGPGLPMPIGVTGRGDVEDAMAAFELLGFPPRRG